jgi:VWFA-related protein
VTEAFTPKCVGRFTRGLQLAACSVPLLASVAVRAQEPPRYLERVEVARVLVDVRVVDAAGAPITGLGRDDFEVRVGNRRARVESVQWVGVPGDGEAHAHGGDAELREDDETRADDLPGAAGSTVARGDGRLIVFLFQKSLLRSRIEGLMLMLRDAQDVLDGLTPADRVAVLSFDSHLRIWLDFTADVTRVRRVFDEAVLFGAAAPVQQSDGPSLLDRLTPAQGRRTYSIEQALERIGDALAPLPGAKSLVFVGHGFGDLGLAGVTLRPTYDRARQALQAARTSVFCLDVTRADYHSLEKGLQVVAQDTGGFFARTHIFPAQAIARLAGALSGHYVLFVEGPPLRPGVHPIDVRVKGGRTVLVSRNYVVGS